MTDIASKHFTPEYINRIFMFTYEILIYWGVQNRVLNLSTTTETKKNKHHSHEDEEKERNVYRRKPNGDYNYRKFG